MTGSQIKEFTENVLDGLTIDDDFFYQLLNIAKTKLEEQRIWQYLKKLDSSNTASSTAISLPSDFAQDYRVLVGTSNEYLPVAFEEQHIYQNSSGRYFIDWANLTLKLLGSNIPSQTLYLYYKKFTPDIESDTSPVFPERFHPLLGYYVAAYYQSGVDSDDVFARMAPENRLAAIELERAMKMWDSSIAMRSQDNTIGVANSNAGIPLEMM
jgi:hypothetical protein